MGSATANTTALVVGGVLAYTYFLIGESHVSPDSKCEYTYPWTTDAFAWVGGAILAYYGFKHDEPVVIGIGSCMFILHTAQFATNRVIKRIGGNK